MTLNVSDAAARKRLAPRREPYWINAAGKGKHLGYRKTKSGGFWIAKLRTPDGERTTHALGSEDELDYADALKAALEWFGGTAAPAQSDVKIRDIVSAYLDYLYNHRARPSYISA